MLKTFFESFCSVKSPFLNVLLHVIIEAVEETFPYELSLAASLEKQAASLLLSDRFIPSMSYY